MIVSIWVYFLLGDSLEQAEHRTAYVQQVATSHAHDVTPEAVEESCQREFHRLYPGYVVCDSGWCQQNVWVMGRD